VAAAPAVLEGGKVKVDAAKLGAHEGMQLVAGRLGEAAARLPVLGLGFHGQLHAHWTFTGKQLHALFIRDSYLSHDRAAVFSPSVKCPGEVWRTSHKANMMHNPATRRNLTAKLGAATVM
jgi:hypothetical protein